MVASMSDSGVSSASRSSKSSRLASALSLMSSACDSASSVALSARVMKCRRTVSMDATLICWQIIRYWISPSLAALPFFDSTQMVRNRMMTSSIAGCQVRCLLEERTSWRATSASCVLPTETSSSARLSAFSGLAKCCIVSTPRARTAARNPELRGGLFYWARVCLCVCERGPTPPAAPVRPPPPSPPPRPLPRLLTRAASRRAGAASPASRRAGAASPASSAPPPPRLRLACGRAARCHTLNPKPTNHDTTQPEGSPSSPSG